jgi:hypothetical protein
MTSVIDTMLQEHAAVLARREAARLAFIEADADAQALTRLINDQGASGVPGASLDYDRAWLQAGERASAALWKTLMPGTAPFQIAEAYQRWQARLEQLRAAPSRAA